MPSRYVIRNEIDDLYNSFVIALKKSLYTSVSCALTTDACSSSSMQSYITYTVHHIDDEWTIKHAVLQTRTITVNIIL